MDVLIIFIFPWAVGLKALGYAGLVVVLVLVSIVVTGYIYAWKKRALQWQ
jgi:NADH-quinone oxidoreductase subunit A